MDTTVPLSYSTLGDPASPILLFLHGLTQARGTWAGIGERYADDWFVVLADHRGHGESPRADRYLAGDFADDAAALLRSLGVGTTRGPAVAVGHSLGGLTVQAMAVRHPEVLRALLAEDPPNYDGEDARTNGPSSPRGRFAMMAETLDEMHARNAPFDEYTAMAAATVNAHGGTAGDRLSAEGLRLRAQALHDVDTATLRTASTGEMWADYDPEADYATSGIVIGANAALAGVLDEAKCRRLQVLMPHLEVVYLDGAAHNIHTDAETRDQFLDILDRFLDGHKGAAS